MNYESRLKWVDIVRGLRRDVMRLALQERFPEHEKAKQELEEMERHGRAKGWRHPDDQTPEMQKPGSL
ncbi:hypothetical protein [Bosea sp. WAO]|uniref:hypothetical protein n=1 Tax=Bosea sp. WAO TaxID=406341 RepID=UPI0009F95804|nr:hypothetical protein [Bosea sp. WAO]